MNRSNRHFQLPDGFVLPRPKRPTLRVRLSLALLILVIVGAGLGTLNVLGSMSSQANFLTALVWASAPLIPTIWVYLWLDRYESEPPAVLLFAFVWGAGLATFGALNLNAWSFQVIETITNPERASQLGAAFAAPVVEESFKGLGLLVIAWLLRREFDGIIDGLVYAGMIGLGFAFLENVLYLVRALNDQGSSFAVKVFILRCLVAPFAHPLFTSAIGIGFGIALRSRYPIWRITAPILGWGIAVLVHGLWNATLVFATRGFLLFYLGVAIPMFLVALALALAARKREAQLIRSHLHRYGELGWFSPSEIDMLGSMPLRANARRWARQLGGRTAHRAMRDFQELASEVAFLRERMNRRDADAEAPQLEHDMLMAMLQIKASFAQAYDATQMRSA